MTNQSTSERVKRSMVSMLFGRVISAVGGIFVLLLLSRLMPQNDYGIYFAVLAIVEICILASNFGLMHAAYRYVSANVDSSGNIQKNGPIGPLVLWRIVSLVIAAALLQLLPDNIATKLQLDNTHSIMLWVGLILLFEGMARYWEVLFDSMLLQGRSQLTLGLRTLIRLFGVLTCYMLEIKIVITVVVTIEVIATFFGALIGAWLLFSINNKAIQHQSQPESISRMLRFALPAFAAQLIGVIYGPDALKLILAERAGLEALALFGFAYSLASVVQRYMPANLFAGIFRPMFVAAAKKDNGQQVLGQLIVLSIKLNWILIIPAAAIAYWVGEPLLTFISHGRYSESGALLSIIIASLLPMSLHLILGHYCLAIENSMPSLFATIAAIPGLPIAYFLAVSFAANGAGIALVVSELIWCAVCLILIKPHFIAVNTGALRGLARLIVGPVFAGVFLLMLQHYAALPWHMAGVAFGLLFILIIRISVIFSREEGAWIMRVIPKGSLIKNIVRIG